MAGAVVSSVASWLGTQLINEGNFLHCIEVQVRTVQHDLQYIALYLTEAESGGEGRSEQLRLFENQIREIAFRAEDVVDNYILQAASSSNIARPNIDIIGMEMKAIHNSIQEAWAQFHQFQKARFVATREGFNRPRAHRNAVRTYPHTEDAYVVGRDEDVKDLVQRLICCKETRVVAIVGAGGIGKTTLARKIYTDRRVQNHFKAAAWVTISQQWNQKDLLFDILRQTRGISVEERNSIKKWSEQELVEKIHGFLSHRSYLLVLDDMWKREAWDCIYPAISGKGFGNKVIITTRKEDLPSQLVDQNCITHRLELLTEEDSWELFQKIALEKKDTQVIVDDDVVRLGREMTKKCDGLPLGIVTLAGLLRTKYTSEWEGVSRRFDSILLNVQGPSLYGRSVYQTLTLSYCDLPYYLKPCFLYLAVFPEDDDISCKTLTRMWVAEGFVTTHDGSVQVNESIEDAADRFLNELIQRCVVQVVQTSFTTGKAKKCRLHDLTREFCIAKAEEQCFLKVFSSTNQSNTTSSAPTPTRRAIIHTRKYFLPAQHPHVRSFLHFSKSVMWLAQYEDLKLLRVLILYRVVVPNNSLPEEFGNLRHLRHVAFTKINLKIVPESIGNLSNLLYLQFSKPGGRASETLPNVFWKMKLLRHLYLVGNWTFPEGLKLRTLTNLQTLWFIRDKHSEVAEMEKLGPSLKKLRIADIGSQSILDAVFRSPCMVSGNLEHLNLDWNSGVKLKSSEPLYKRCQRLRKLKLCGEIGEDDPLQFPPNLVWLELCLCGLKLHDPLVAAGRLGHVKYLNICWAYRGVEMTCNAGSFPQLEELIVEKLYNLEEWRVEEGAMPRLKKLRIARCLGLKRLPEGLKFIRSLQELEIHMPITFCHKLFRERDRWHYEYRAELAKEDEGGDRGEDFHIIQHISHVHFNADWISEYTKSDLM